MYSSSSYRQTILGLTILFGWANAGLTQGLPGDASSLTEGHGDWTISCVTPDGNVRCAITQSQVSGENRQRVLAVELQPGPDDSATGNLVLPFGLLLSAGVTLQIDEQSPIGSLQFRTCLPAGCVVPLLFDRATLDLLDAGKTLNVTAKSSGDEKEIALGISLNGFSTGLARTRSLTER